MSGTYNTFKKSDTAESRDRLPDGSRLVVVGHGMVATRFCETLVKKGLASKITVTVIGEEPEVGYDRVKLSTFVDHRDATKLELKPREWYAENGIEVVSGKRVEAVEREAKRVRLVGGEELEYDALVFATGSRPFVPPIAGSDSPGVFVYRTVADLEDIIGGAKGKTSAIVIGGGLLGLEAAQAVKKLGLEAGVIERARFLMPQQLNAEAAGLLGESVRAQGIDLHLGIQQTTITNEDDQLSLNLDEVTIPPVDLVVISAGIAPNSELAESCDLATGARGGIVVDDHFETEDESVFAIGECALVHGRIYGLVAPGYAMADHLVERLMGKKVAPFPERDLSTRLKMLGADVVTIGAPLEEGVRVEFKSDEHYRMLLLGGDGELRGALGVGPWPEAGMVQSLFEDGGYVREAEQRYFESEGVFEEGAPEVDVASWPDSRTVCNCTNVRKGAIIGCLEKCGRDPDKVAEETGASMTCGSCRPLLEQLCGAPVTAQRPVAARALLVASVIALCVVIATIVAPPVPLANSVESWRFTMEQLWRDTFVKQITGYGLTAVFVIGLLISLRKRLPRLRIGHFGKWRFFHATFGIVSLVVLFAHTGFRFGHNLNYWLMLTFVLLNLLGACAGIASAIEASGTSNAALVARRFRGLLTYSHLVLFWPLPVLLIFHVLSVYLY